MFSFIRSRHAKKALAAAMAVTMVMAVTGCAKKEYIYSHIKKGCLVHIPNTQ